jgi:two-component system nitrogen regulation response regulator GlnG
VKADVRIIAATNKPLEKAVADKEFREDLFYRLNVVRIEIPPLRQRKDDIRLLVDYFLKKFSQRQQSPKSISPDTLEMLANYNWPGNVRELENVIHRAIVVTKGDVILPIDLPAGIRQPLPRASESQRQVSSRSDPDAEAKAGDQTDIPAIARTLFVWARKNSSLKLLPAVERELIINALAEMKGNQVQAAKLLGITRATLRKRVDKFKIQREISIR